MKKHANTIIKVSIILMVIGAIGIWFEPAWIFSTGLGIIGFNIGFYNK